MARTCCFIHAEINTHSIKLIVEDTIWKISRLHFYILKCFFALNSWCIDLYKSRFQNWKYHHSFLTMVDFGWEWTLWYPYFDILLFLLPFLTSILVVFLLLWLSWGNQIQRYRPMSRIAESVAEVRLGKKKKKNWTGQMKIVQINWKALRARGTEAIEWS